MTDFTNQAIAKISEEMADKRLKDWAEEQGKLRGHDQFEKPNYQSATGALRASEGKLQMSMVPLDLLDGAARVLTIGAAKYGKHNFRLKFPPDNVLDSMMRHLVELQTALRTQDKDGHKGHLHDKETKEAHVHHMVCNLLILIDSMRGEGWDV